MADRMTGEMKSMQEKHLPFCVEWFGRFTDHTEPKELFEDPKILDLLQNQEIFRRAEDFVEVFNDRTKKISTLNLMRIFWAVYAPVGMDYFDSSRDYHQPFVVERVRDFSPAELSLEQIRAIMEFIAEFSKDEYRDKDWIDKSMENYLYLSFSLFSYIEKIEDNTEREVLIQRCRDYINAHWNLGIKHTSADNGKMFSKIVKFLFRNKDLSDETRNTIFEEIIEPGIRKVVSEYPNGRFQDNVLYIYFKNMQVFWSEEDLPCGDEFFTRRLCFIMNNLGHSCSYIELFTFDDIPKVLSRLIGAGREQFARFFFDNKYSLHHIANMTEEANLYLLTGELSGEDRIALLDKAEKAVDYCRNDRRRAMLSLQKIKQEKEAIIGAL